MIHLFRRIRQKYLSENRVSKYLIYAIGEILLVVIGILIALQVNNWNEDRKERIKEQEVLSELEQSIVINLETLIQSKRLIENHIRSSEILSAII